MGRWGEEGRSPHPAPLLLAVFVCTVERSSLSCSSAELPAGWAGLAGLEPVMASSATQPSPAIGLCCRRPVIGLKRVHYFWDGPPSRGRPGRMGASATKITPGIYKSKTPN